MDSQKTKLKALGIMLFIIIALSALSMMSCSHHTHVLHSGEFVINERTRTDTFCYKQNVRVEYKHNVFGIHLPIKYTLDGQEVILDSVISRPQPYEYICYSNDNKTYSIFFPSHWEIRQGVVAGIKSDKSYKIIATRCYGY